MGIERVLEEIKKNFMEGHLFAVFYPDNNGKTTGHFHFTNNQKAQQLADLYETNISGSFLRVELSQLDLLEAEKDFLKKIEKFD